MSKYRMRSSVRQEKKIAADVAGHRVAGSGNQPGLKGDVKCLDWLIEAKQTVRTSTTLKLSVWRKIESEAIKAAKEPAIVLDIAGRELAVIDYKTFLHLSRFLKELDY